MENQDQATLVKLQQIAENSLTASLAHARANTSLASVRASTGSAAAAFRALKRMCKMLQDGGAK